MNEIPHIENLGNNGWMGVVTMLILLGYLLSLGLSGSQYIKRISSLGKQRRRMVNYGDEVMDWRADVTLGVSVLLSVAMCAFCVLVRAGWVGFSVLNYLAAIIATLLVFVLRTGIAHLVGYVFRLSVDVASMKMMAVYVVFGILCLLLSMFVAADIDKSYLYSSIAILLVSGIIAEIVILVENFFAKTGSLFYIFLYLCAAEILPLAVGFRIVFQVFN